MEVTVLRCKHCKKRYVYSSIGKNTDLVDVGSSKEYCSVCQKAIDEALNNIPVRYVHKYIEVTDEKQHETLNQIFNEEKEHNKGKTHIYFEPIFKLEKDVELSDSDKYFNEIEILYYEKRKYIRAKYKDNPYPYIFADMELSTITNKVEDYWYYNKPNAYQQIK